METTTAPRIVDFYDRAPLASRLFVSLRAGSTRFAELAALLPRAGTILDVGCGHGLLAANLAVTEPDRHVLALDHDVERIRLATEAFREIPNLRFEEGRIEDLAQGFCDGMTAIDVLHYLTPVQQEDFIANAARSLKPDGVLVLREVDPTLGLASSWNRIYEFAAINSGMTKTPTGHAHYRSTADWTRLLRDRGFDVEVRPRESFAFADIVFRCTKRASGTETALESLARRRVRITADDWGMSSGVNLGILELAKLGVVTRVSMMADAPRLTEGLDELRTIEGLEF
ncbi:MAG: methyltransferase domain-containing protein, partial [Bdellovibrionota bacterium]